MEYLWQSASWAFPWGEYIMNFSQCYVLIKTLNVIETPQARQAIILIKSYLLVSGLFVKSIFHSKCHFSLSSAMHIGWDIHLKHTWDFFLSHGTPIWLVWEGGKMDEDCVRLGCRGTVGGCNVVLYLRENRNDRKWQIPYGFRSRQERHTNEGSVQRHKWKMCTCGATIPKCKPLSLYLLHCFSYTFLV